MCCEITAIKVKCVLTQEGFGKETYMHITILTFTSHYSIQHFNEAILGTPLYVHVCIYTSYSNKSLFYNVFVFKEKLCVPSFTSEML